MSMRSTKGYGAKNPTYQFTGTNHTFNERGINHE